MPGVADCASEAEASGDLIRQGILVFFFGQEICENGADSIRMHIAERHPYVGSGNAVYFQRQLR